MTRKQHVQVSQLTIYEYVRDHGVTDVNEIMVHFDISFTSAWRKLIGLVHQGKLIHDEYDAEGYYQPQQFQRFGIA